MGSKRILLDHQPTSNRMATLWGLSVRLPKRLIA
jgi:hypothetical protein